MVKVTIDLDGTTPSENLADDVLALVASDLFDRSVDDLDAATAIAVYFTNEGGA